MNKRFAVTLALAVSLSASACTSTVHGTPTAAPVQPETTLSGGAPQTTTRGKGITEMPQEYAALGRQIADATNAVSNFWKQRGVDLSDITVKMFASHDNEPCPPPIIEYKGDQPAWTCRVANVIAINLPAEQADYDKAGSGVPYFTIGHELGHYVDYRRDVPTKEENVEALANCLSGAAAAGNGTAAEVSKAAIAIFGADSMQDHSVTFGINNGVQSCFDGAR